MMMVVHFDDSGAVQRGSFKITINGPFKTRNQLEDIANDLADYYRHTLEAGGLL
jgi:hypothetical protein